MNIFKCLLVILILCPLLGCPYEEIYKYDGNPIVQNDTEISSSKVFFKKWKGKATCSIGLVINNKSEELQRFNFQKSSITNLSDTSYIINTYLKMGERSNSNAELIVPPKSE